jgi:hypothetical protein
MSDGAIAAELKIAYHPGFATQPAWGTPIDQSLLTEVVQAVSPNHIEPFKTVADVFDCTQQYKIGSRVLKRGARIRLQIKVDAKRLAGWTAYAFGAAGTPSSGTSAITMLGPKSFQPPVFTIIVGYDDDEDPGIVLFNAVVDKLEVVGRSGEEFVINIDIVGDGSLTPATSFVWPACTDIVPIYFEDGALTVNSVDRFTCATPNQTTHEFSFSYSNNLAIDDGRPMAKKDFIRLNRKEKRDYMADWKVEGRPNDTLAALAHARDTSGSFSFRIGSSSQGVTYTVTKCEFAEGSPLVSHEGELRRAALNLRLNPLRISGNAATPCQASATFTGNTAQFLQPSA